MTPEQIERAVAAIEQIAASLTTIAMKLPSNNGAAGYHLPRAATTGGGTSLSNLEPYRVGI